MLEPIVRRAHQLRRALRMSVGTVGISLVIFVVMLFFLVSYTLDFFLPEHLDFFQRALLLVLALGGLVFIVIRYTVLPLGGRYSVDSLVLALEKAHPQLDDALISSLQLDRRLAEGDTSMSRVMAALVIEDGLARAREVDPAAPIDRARVNLFGGGGLLCVFLLGASFAVGPMQTWTWFGRNVLLQPWQYIQRTSLSLYQSTGGETWKLIPPGQTIKIARGEDLSLEVRADPSKHVPAKAYLRYRFARSGNRGELAKGPVDGKTLANRYRFRMSKIPESLFVTIRGGDYQPPEAHPEWEIVALEPPVILWYTLEYSFPPYTRMPDRVFDSRQGGGNQRLPVGTKIKLTAHATKEIVQVAVVSETREDIVGGQMGESLQTLDVPSKTFSEELILIKGGEVFIELLDYQGVQNQMAAQVKITAIPDEGPSISARIVGVGQMITNRATVPLHLTLDDDYGTRAAAIAAECSGKKKPYDLFEIKKLHDAARRTVPFGPPKVEGIYRWDIALLDTKAGDRLSFNVQATDNEVLMLNPVPGAEGKPRLPILDGANVGESETISLKIVTAQELINELISRQIEIHQEFVALIDQQVDRRASTLGLKGKLARQGGVTGTLATELKDIWSFQSKVPEDLDRTADRLLGVATEMVNNRIDSKAELDILRNRLAAPLQVLAKGHALEAAKGLDEARSTEDAGQRDGILNQVLARQQLTIRGMKVIAELMKKKITIDQIRRNLIIVIRDEEEIRKMTDTLYRNWLKGVIDPDDDDDPPIID